MIAEKYSGHLNTDGTMNDIDGNPTIDFERILFEEYGETIMNYSEDPNNPIPGDHDPKEVSTTGWARKGARDKMALKILEQRLGLENTVIIDGLTFKLIDVHEDEIDLEVSKI